MFTSAANIIFRCAVVRFEAFPLSFHSLFYCSSCFYLPRHWLADFFACHFWIYQCDWLAALPRLTALLTYPYADLPRYRPARPPVCRALGFLSYRLAAFSISQVLSLRRAGRVIGSKKETARPAVSYNEFLNYHSLNSDLCISITQIIHFRNLYYPERQTYRLLSHNTTHFVFISLSTLQ